MFKTMVFSASGAALVVCLLVSVLQFVTTVPMIQYAEQFEDSAGHSHSHDSAGADVAHTHDEGAWSPEEGFERAAYTGLANLVIGFAVALILLGAMALRGDPISAVRGLLWGIGGFAAVTLMPAIGLPPELPGTPAADIVLRQLWWTATAAASAVALLLLFFASRWWLKALAVVLLVAPHAVGAPQAPSHDVAYPAALAGQYVFASLVSTGLLWSSSGLIAGWLYQHLSASRT